MPETDATVIPQLRQVFRLTKAELDALAGLRDGALGYATDETILYRQNGDGAANWEAITSAGTKEIFAPVYDETVSNNFGPNIDAVGNDLFMAIKLPHDFNIITSLEVIFFSGGGVEANMNFGFITRWGTDGEVWNIHTENEAPRNIGAIVANYQYIFHSIADLVNVVAPVAGDLLVVEVNYDATPVVSDANVYGLILRYS